MRLFGTDGIRGVAGVYPLDAATVRRIAVSAAQILKKGNNTPVIIMGRDTRESGEQIAEQLKEGLSSEGIEVWDLGVVPTPGGAFMVRRHPVVAGVVISASHNPYQDNGIKFFGPQGTKLSDAVESEIEKLIHSDTTANNGSVRAAIKLQGSLIRLYNEFLTQSFSKGHTLSGMRLVADCANGATCTVASEVLSSLGATVHCLNVTPDGKNINKDSGSLHPEKLAAEVARQGAHCGLAFDGDGDRIIFVDETGTVRDGDYILSIAAGFRKKMGTLTNNTLVTTVMANLGLFHAMESQDIKVLQTPVGDRYVYEGMVRTGAVVGGEQSGHIIFREYLQTGDGILSALQILSIMKETGESLSSLSRLLTKYPQVLINARVAKKVSLESLPKTKTAMRAAEEKLHGDGRVLVRYSGTENLLRVMIEGQDKKEIDALANGITEIATKEIQNI